jgi:5-hydroxyisourate hydrolase
MAARDPITSHVLDQLAGQPAAGVAAVLTPLIKDLAPGTPAPTFSATTAADSGRIAAWACAADPALSLHGFLASLRTNSVSTARWRLTFDTGKYWEAQGVKSFYPQVDVVFETDLTEGREHWHVPVLLGPYGYTTYRGT